MKLPRDVDASQFIQALKKLGYEPTRQTGSHIRVRTLQGGDHSETIPNHSPLKAGTLNAILRNIGRHHRLERDDLLRLLDSRPIKMSARAKSVFKKTESGGACWQGIALLKEHISRLPSPAHLLRVFPTLSKGSKP